MVRIARIADKAVAGIHRIGKKQRLIVFVKDRSRGDAVLVPAVYRIEHDHIALNYGFETLKEILYSYVSREDDLAALSGES